MGTTFSIRDRQAQGLRRVLIPLLVALTLMASQLPMLGAGPAHADVSGWLDLQDADGNVTRVEYDSDKPGGDAEIPGYHWDEDPNGTFHLSCSETIVQTTVTVTDADIAGYPVGTTLTIVNFSNTFTTGGGNSHSCSADTFHDIDLTKTSSTAGPVATGDSFSYTITATRTVGTPEDVVITDTVPTGFTVDSATYTAPGGNGSCDVTGQLVTCEVGDLHSGSAVVTINATVDGTETCVTTENVARSTGGNIANDETAPVFVEIGSCAPPPVIELVKIVDNQHGGTATIADFQAQLDGANVAWNTPIVTTAGSHTASEIMNVSGYVAGTWGGDCDPDGTITLVDGDEATCTITNSDVQPTLTLEKEVDNSAGGTATEDDFQASIDGQDVDWDAPTGLDAGDYTVSETTLPGYVASGWGGDCAADGSVSLAVGDEATCTITNTAVAPTLTVVKQVINNHGGSLNPDDFPLFIDDTAVVSGESNDVVAGVEYTVSEEQQPGYAQTDLVCVDDDTSEEVAHPVTLALAQSVTCTITNDDVMPGLTVLKNVINDDGGSLGPDDFQLRVNGGPIDHGVPMADPQAGVAYEVTEDDPTELGYEEIGTVCLDAETQAEVDNPVTLALGQSVVCTITNDDVGPTVTVTKQVINDDGGTAEVADFTLYLGEFEVASGASNDVTAGTEYTVSEDLVEGYEQVSLECTDGEKDLGSTFTPELAQDIDCVIVNDDVGPTVTVTKQVINDDGGTAEAGDFTLLLGDDEVVSGASNAVTAGVEYTVSEVLVDGYEQVGFICTDGEQTDVGATFTPALGQNISCVFVNDDIAPMVTVTKQVINDDGGAAEAGDFTLLLGDDEVVSGASNDVTAGVEYTVSEELVEGYEQVSLECTDGEVDLGGTFTPELAQDIDCVIVNDDVAPTVTVIKQVINDDGGTAEPGDFPLYLGDDEVVSGASNAVTAGVEYTVSEDQQAGYAQTGLVCVDDDTEAGVTHPVTLALAQSVTCTITNDDVAPGLTVVKNVINDDGGSLGPDDFRLRVNGDAVDHGVALADPQAGVAYEVTEDDPADLGYEEIGTVCVDTETQVEVDNPVTLALGQSVVCTITNDDIAPTVTVTKEVVNDDGGTAEVGDFALYLGEVSVTSGASNDVVAGTEYTVSEDLVDGYEQVSLECTDGEVALGGTFTPELAQDITCVIVNDDVAPTVTVTKEVVNDDGGTAEAGDFTLLLGDDEVVSGASNDVTAGVEYTVSEELVEGYEQVSLECTDGEVDLGGTFTPELAQDIDCVIVNDDLPSGITLVKEAVLEADDEGIKAIEVAEGETATVTYRFLVTNTGETTLTDLTLVDDKIGPVTLDVDTLAPGESTEAFADYTLTEADITAGQVDNIGTVTGTDVFGNDQVDNDDETVFVIEVLDVVSGIDLIKTALVDTDGNGNKVVEVQEGETTTVTYRYLITNTGNSTIEGLTLVDDKIGAITLPGTSLAAGASMTVDVDYTLTAADIAAGAVENVAVVTGTDETGTEVSDTDDEVVEILEVREVVVVVPTEVKPAVISRPLPRTGTDGQQLFALAVLLAAVGAATLLFTPRRRRDS